MKIWRPTGVIPLSVSAAILYAVQHVFVNSLVVKIGDIQVISVYAFACSAIPIAIFLSDKSVLSSLIAILKYLPNYKHLILLHVITIISQVCYYNAQDELNSSAISTISSTSVFYGGIFDYLYNGNKITLKYVLFALVVFIGIAVQQIPLDVILSADINLNHISAVLLMLAVPGLYVWRYYHMSKCVLRGEDAVPYINAGGIASSLIVVVGCFGVSAIWILFGYKQEHSNLNAAYSSISILYFIIGNIAIWFGGYYYSIAVHQDKTAYPSLIIGFTPVLTSVLGLLFYKLNQSAGIEVPQAIMPTLIQWAGAVISAMAIIVFFWLTRREQSLRKRREGLAATL